jgi:ELWxxDGT repeat protein
LAARLLSDIVRTLPEGLVMFRVLIAILLAPYLLAQSVSVTDIERAPANSGDWDTRYYQVGERVIVIKGTSKSQTLQLWEVGERNALKLLSSGEHGDVFGLQVWDGRLIYATKGKPQEPSVLWGIEKPGAEPARLGEYKFKTATVFGVPTVSHCVAGVMFVSGNELVLTDGTPAGTKVVKTMPEFKGREGVFVGAAGGVPLLLAPAEDGYTLWKTDRTANGILELTSIATQGHPLKQAADGEAAAFLIGGEGGQIWHSDGTAAGTRKLAQATAERTSIFDFAVLGDQYLLSIRGPDCELHALKRGAEKPEVVMNFGRNQGGQSVAHDLTTVGSLVYYRREYAAWRTDGTADGTLQLAKGLSLGSSSIFTPVGGRCVFRSADGMGFSDGTEAGTRLSADFSFWMPSPIGAKLRFVSSGRWCETDGTPEGTREVVDLVTVTADSNLKWLTAMGENLYGVGTVKATGGSRAHLYRLPPTGAPVVLATAPNSTLIKDLVVVDQSLFFSMSNLKQGTEDLWLSDGTPEGTRLVKAGLESIDAAQACCGKLYFVESGLVKNAHLWQSDGTPAGTKEVVDPAGKGLSSIQWRPPEHYTARDMIQPLGVALKTALVVGRREGRGNALYKVGDEVEKIATFDNLRATFIDMRLFPLAGCAGIVFNTLDSGSALWFSDGTAAGTRELFYLESTTIHCSPRDTATLGDATYFIVYIRGKYAVWRASGTTVSAVHYCDLPTPGRMPGAGLHANDDGTLIWATEKGTWRVGPELEKPEQLSNAPALLATSGELGMHVIEAPEKEPLRVVLVAKGKLSEVCKLEQASFSSVTAPHGMRVGDVWWFVAYHERFGKEPWRVALKKE